MNVPSPALKSAPAASFLTGETPIRYVKGVGPQMAMVFAKMGITIVEDLLLLTPRDYEDRSRPAPLSGLIAGEPALIRARLMGVKAERTRRGFSVIKADLQDGAGRITAVWFNQPFLEPLFQKKIGAELFVSGKAEYESFRGEMIFSVRQYEWIDPETPLQGLVPIYPLTEGLTQKFVRRAIQTILATVRIHNPFPESEITQAGYLSRPLAFRTLHNPRTLEEALAARERFVFEDFFAFSIGVNLLKQGTHQKIAGVTIGDDPDSVEEFEGRLPFKLTAAQRRVMKELARDMESGRPMSRLLQGDVGSGKTVVAAYCVWRAVSNGAQAAVMAPTEILASQMAGRLREFLLPWGIPVAYLSGNIQGDARKKIFEMCLDGSQPVLVGTHALIQEGVHFSRLGFALIDEQHRFGVVQRRDLVAKGQHPHTLVMTATPIPRSLSLTLYGDLDLSILDELPAGRGVTRTHRVAPADLSRVYELVRAELVKGHQVYVVCPLIELSEKIDLQAAAEKAQELQTQVFTEYTVGLLHGRMKPAEKEAVMRAFSEKKIHVLVSTTVIEVGIDVPNATVMLIEHADRFGLSQLHQLRGRVGRGGASAWCFLIQREGGGDSRERLETLVRSSDGFEIAEIDLKLRGPGDFCGTRQSGLPLFRVADILRDGAVLERARECAQSLTRTDPRLEGPALRTLRREVERRYGSYFHLRPLT